MQLILSIGRLLLKIATAFGLFGALSRLIFGRRIAAVMGLTWKAAFRFRLFLVVAVLLLGTVIVLPMLIKDDGTAHGFTQILLTYTLSVTTALLGLSTLWLACGTLARDIEEAQMQMVAVKPIRRWQIWVGKWLGLVTLNAALLAIAGVGVYALLQTRAARLPVEEQRRLRNEVLVSRGSVRERSVQMDIESRTDAILQDRLKQANAKDVNVKELRAMIHEQVKAGYQTVDPGFARRWRIDLGYRAKLLQDRPLQARVKFYSAQRSPTGTFPLIWEVGEAGKTSFVRMDPMSLASETFHEFEIPANMYDENGLLTITCVNVTPVTLLFQLDDGMEVLFREGGFEMNYLRGLGIILFWMALLAAIGLASASLMSFPVAAFVSLGVLILALSSGTMTTVVTEGGLLGHDTETGRMVSTPIDGLVIPAFKGALKVIKLAKDFAPIESLSTGRSISWEQFGLAFVRIVVLLAGVIGIAGILIFNRRELATAQGNQ